MLTTTEPGSPQSQRVVVEGPDDSMINRDYGTTGTISHPDAKTFSSLDTANGVPERKKSSGRAGISPGSPVVPELGASHTVKPTATPEQWLHRLLRALGSKNVGRKWQCPAHALTGEHSLSLTTGTGDDGRVLLYCHAGCGWPSILRALHIPAAALRVAPPTPPDTHANVYLRNVAFPPPKADERGSPEQRGFHFESEHPYGPDVWLVRLRSKSGAKEVTWESRNVHGDRCPGLFGRRTKELPLYRQQEVLQAIGADEPVLLVESESSVDALCKAGWYATTWAGGAGSPPLELLKRVLSVEDDSGVLDTYPKLVIIPDYDDAGVECLNKLNDAGLLIHLVHGNVGEDAKDLLLRIGQNAFRALITEALTP